MPWIAKPKFFVENKLGQKGIPRKGTVYPWLPAIIDEETLTEITTLESGEHAFVSQQGRERRRYLSGLYLKAVSVLGHSHFQPRDLSLQFRRKMASQLECDRQLTRILTIVKAEKSRIVSPIRSFLGLNKADRDVRDSLRSWLENTIARKETEIPMVVNSAVHYLRERKIELPSRNKLNSIAKKAIKQASENFIDMINDSLSRDEQSRLELLAKGKILERFKMPVPQASPNNLVKQLQRIAEIRKYVPQNAIMESTFRLHLESFAELTATVLNSSIPMAHAFMKAHDNNNTLPTAGCPIDFLEQPWKRLAVRQYARTGEILWVVKKPYELGLYDATVQGLKRGDIAIPNSYRYAPMVDHLLDRDEFLKNYDDHVKRLGQPATAHEYYDPMLDRLDSELNRYDQQYDKFKKTFWINKDGTLGFSSVPGKTIPKRLKRIKNDMGRKMPRVSIFDILLDCHRWTGFLNAFKPTSGRQNMPEEERLRSVSKSI